MSVSVSSVSVSSDVEGANDAREAISKWMNGIEEVHTHTNTYIIILFTNGTEFGQQPR